MPRRSEKRKMWQMAVFARAQRPPSDLEKLKVLSSVILHLAAHTESCETKKQAKCGGNGI